MLNWRPEKKNVSSFLGLQMRSAICNTMDTLSSDLVRCNHSLIKGTNVPWRNTCFQEWDNKKNETWTSSNVTEWGSSREKKSYADGHMWVTHKDLPSSQMKEMTSEVQIQKTRSRVWISGSMSTLLVFEYSMQKEGKGQTGCMDLWIQVNIVREWEFNLGWWQSQTGFPDLSHWVYVL